MKHPLYVWGLKILSTLIQTAIFVLLFYFGDYFMFTLITNVHQLYHSWTATLLVSVWVLYAHYNVMFNYYMACNSPSGQSTDVALSDISNKSDTCPKCQYPKPKGCYHCAICNKCTLQMDHHCPWVACIGRQNRRYFVGFLTYVCVFVVNILVLNSLLSPENKSTNQDYELIQLLFGGLFIIMFLFAAFHWYLVFTGKTSLGVCMKRESGPSKSHWQNLQRIFGTQSVVLALLPSTRDLCHPIQPVSYQFQSQGLVSTP